MSIFKKPSINGSFISRSLIIIIASVVVNVAVLAVAKPFVAVPNTFDPFFYSSVIELTVAGVLGAAVVYILMASLSFVKDLNKSYLVVSIICLVLSYIPDFTLPYSPDQDSFGATPAAIAVLLLMHTLSAAIVIWGFYRHAQNKAPQIQEGRIA